MFSAVIQLTFFRDRNVLIFLFFELLLINFDEGTVSFYFANGLDLFSLWPFFLTKSAYTWVFPLEVILLWLRNIFSAEWWALPEFCGLQGTTVHRTFHFVKWVAQKLSSFLCSRCWISSSCRQMGGRRQHEAEYRSLVSSSMATKPTDRCRSQIKDRDDAPRQRLQLLWPSTLLAKNISSIDHSPSVYLKILLD